MYDLSTPEQTQISGSQAAMSPAIYGDTIVWMDSRNSGKWDYLDSVVNWNIYMYNISTSKETRLFSNKSMKMFPAIYKDKIVWMDSRNGGSGNYWNLTGNWDIYMYDLSTHKGTQITNNGSMQLYPAIYENRIVWLDARNGNWDIYGYDLSTFRETFISSVRSPYAHPAVYLDRIVWADWRSGNADIYMYDLSTSRETQITTNESRQEHPAIFRDRIVWQDERNGNTDVYMCTVSGEDTGSDTEQKSERGENKGTKNKSTPGFEIVFGVVSLLGYSSIRKDRKRL
jgi:beta propeller repeat protein